MTGFFEGIRWVGGENAGCTSPYRNVVTITAILSATDGDDVGGYLYRVPKIARNKRLGGCVGDLTVCATIFSSRQDHAMVVQ